MADASYGAAEILGWMVHERGIQPHISVFNKSSRSDGSISRPDITYDPMTIGTTDKSASEEKELKQYHCGFTM